MRVIAFAALTSLAVAACSSGGGEQSAEARFPPVGQFLDVDGLKVHYVDQGEGPVVILVHGANGNVRDFTFSMIDRLDDNHRVIAFDRPGHGYSDRPERDGAVPRTQAGVLSEATSALGVENAVLVGHSWGGAVVTAWALDHPEQVAGVAVLAGATYPWGGGGGALYSLGSGPFGGVLGAAARTYASGERLESLIGDVFAPNPPIDGYAQHIGVELALRPTTFRYNAEDIDELNDNLVAQSARYGELTMPLEILHGDADETVGLEVHSIPLWRAAPNANLTVLKGVGHMLHHVEEDEMIEAIKRLTGVSQ